MLYPPACLDCSVKNEKIVFMKPEKVGVKVRFGCFLGYHKADLWKCPECGRRMLMEWSEEVFEPNEVVDYDFRE